MSQIVNHLKGTIFLVKVHINDVPCILENHSSILVRDHGGRIACKHSVRATFPIIYPKMQLFI